jgi:hypothetical protein
MKYTFTSKKTDQNKSLSEINIEDPLFFITLSLEESATKERFFYFNLMSYIDGDVSEAKFKTVEEVNEFSKKKKFSAESIHQINLFTMNLTNNEKK